ncbi:MAG: phospholipase D family protein [Deltaproteobacteria bacterium]|nr:phospholipase D family protein [Nannocystaceae bacterium]
MRARPVWGAEHYELVVRGVMRAKTSVWIATANLKELMVEPSGGRARRYHSVMVELDRLACSGVELRMLHAGLPSRPFRDEFDAWPRLVAGGLQLRQCPRVHMKIVVVDGAWAYLGSANWTGAGLGAKGEHRRNFELGIVTDDCAVIDDAQRRFDALWRGHECAQCRLRSECEAPLDLELRSRSKARVRGKRSTAGDVVSAPAVVRIGAASSRGTAGSRTRLPASRTRP